MRTLFIISVVLTFLSCSQTEDNHTSQTIENLVSADTTSPPEQTVVNFLKWYKDSGPSLTNDLVLNNGGDWDSTKFYAINFPATEHYLQTLIGTGMISDKYADKWRNYFEKADQNFKDNPANDGPPDGFDYDFITFSQEDPGLSELDKAKLTIADRDENSAVVLIQFPSTHQYKYKLTKKGQQWLIDDIENVTK